MGTGKWGKRAEIKRPITGGSEMRAGKYLTSKDMLFQSSVNRGGSGFL